MIAISNIIEEGGLIRKYINTYINNAMFFDISIFKNQCRGKGGSSFKYNSNSRFEVDTTDITNYYTNSNAMIILAGSTSSTTAKVYHY